MATPLLHPVSSSLRPCSPPPHPQVHSFLEPRPPGWLWATWELQSPGHSPHPETALQLHCLNLPSALASQFLCVASTQSFKIAVDAHGSRRLCRQDLIGALGDSNEYRSLRSTKKEREAGGRGPAHPGSPPLGVPASAHGHGTRGQLPPLLPGSRRPERKESTSQAGVVREKSNG